jgi:hypothetical protein
MTTTKATAKAKAIIQSLRPSGFAPAFGRAVSARLAERGAESPALSQMQMQMQNANANAGVLSLRLTQGQNDAGWNLVLRVGLGWGEGRSIFAFDEVLGEGF